MTLVNVGALAGGFMLEVGCCWQIQSDICAGCRSEGNEVIMPSLPKQVHQLHVSRIYQRNSSPNKHPDPRVDLDETPIILGMSQTV